MNVADALVPRVKKIMWHVGWRMGGRFTGFDANKHDIDYEWRSDNHVLYWVKPNQYGVPYCHNDRFAQVALNNIDFKSLEHVVLSDPVKLGSKVIDAQVLKRDNRNGTSPLKTTYNGTFAESVSESTRFAAEITIGIKASVGSEGPVATSVEAYSEFKTTFEKAGGRDHSVSRSIDDAFEVPAGEYWQLTGKREIAEMERTATGKVDLSHDVWIGSYQSHHLGRDRWDWGGGRSWESFDDFLRVVKCEGPGDLADEFRNDRVPDSMIRDLEQPTAAEVTRTYKYDGTTISDVDIKVL